MKYSNIVAALLGSVHSASAVYCTAEQRINVMKYITAVFNEQDYAESFQGIEGMPLQANCPAQVSVNGSPRFEFGFDAATTKDFANVVRQFFTTVVSEYTDYGNGTTLMDAQVTLGVLHFVDFPVTAHILVPAEFNMTTCLLSRLPADVHVPASIAGTPLSLPDLPPTIQTLPGIRELLLWLQGKSTGYTRS